MSWRVAVLLVAVPLTAAGNLIAGKFALRSFSPMEANALRYTLALVVLLPLLPRWPRLERRDIPMLVANGLTGICVYNLLFFGAMTLIPASEVALLELAIPAGSLALAWLLLHERIGLRQILGMAVSWSGALWLLRILPTAAMTVKTSADWRGELLMAIGVACFSVYAITGKLAVRRLPPPAVAAWSCLFGTVPLVLLAVPPLLADPGTLSRAAALSWMGVVYGGLIGFVFNIIAWYYCFRAVGVARTNIFLYLVPVFGALLAMMIFSERLTGWQLFGAAVMMGGVVLATFERSGAARPAEPVLAPRQSSA